MYGTIFLGGRIDAAAIAWVIAGLHRQGDVQIGLWPDDAALPQFA